MPGGLVTANDNPMPAARPAINPPVVIKTCFQVFRLVVLKIAIPAPVAAHRPVIQLDVFFNFFRYSSVECFSANFCKFGSVSIISF